MSAMDILKIFFYLKGRGFYIAAGGASANHCWAHIQSELAEKGFRACLSDATELMGMLSIQGPNW